MTPAERIRRIRQLHARRVAARAAHRAATEAFVAEVEAAHDDPEAQVSYTQVATEVMGSSRQNLNDLREAVRNRREADAG